ncbi:MAG: HAMP domain-containing histidine kinase [Maledivibacter sp.]|jgi:signal transduction histidine kinase|nr:HAMP domain-containing histidine kinase [Maledivibacter sp.]
MDIKLVSKRGKIGKKLILSYMLVLIIAFLVVGVTFKSILTNYLVDQAKKELLVEGKKIAQNLSRIPFRRERIKEKLANNRSLQILGRHIDARIIVLDNDGNTIYTSFNGSDKKMLAMLRKAEEFEEKGYVTVKVPIKGNNSRNMGYVVLLTRVMELNGLNSVRLRMLLKSFLVAAGVALIVSLFLERSLVKPLMRLRNKMNNFSVKNFDEKIYINTNDEIEELANSFNIMANKLKSYDERQRRFLQNASHELKTPLMSIQGYAEGIKDGVIEGDDINQSLDIIIEESQRMKKLVDEIIYLTKLENVEEIFELKEVDLVQIANNAIKTVKSLALDKGIEIRLEAEGVKLGNYDEEKMKRAFINLVGNGIRYGNRIVFVKIEDVRKYTLIEVMDDGQGFKNDEEKKIFDRFYKGKKGGSGIGLAITKAIVEGHGGTIYAYNHENLGAAFRIKIPKS